jgi:hypothetical protein
LPRFAATSLADFAIAEPSGFDSDLNTLPASSNRNEATHLTAPNAVFDSIRGDAPDLTIDQITLLRGM